MYISDFICCGTGVKDLYSRSKAKILKKLEIVEKQMKVEEGKESRKIDQLGQMPKDGHNQKHPTGLLQERCISVRVQIFATETDN